MSQKKKTIISNIQLISLGIPAFFIASSMNMPEKTGTIAITAKIKRLPVLTDSTAPH
jgi:hypothetical protein